MSQPKADDIHLQYMSFLGSDGPNVNKSIWAKVNSKSIEFGHTGLVDVGMCNIHVVHNAFGKGLDKFGREVEELVIDLHSFFRYSSSWNYN